MLLGSHVTCEHRQDRLNSSFAHARDVVAMGRSRYLGDTESLIDLVSEEAEQVAATVGVQDLGATPAPNEQKESRQQVLSAV
jgi:hypothetical protein